MKYFIDDNIWYQGKRQPPRKVYLKSAHIEPNEKYVTCYDMDDNEYRLKIEEVMEDEGEQENE